MTLRDVIAEVIRRNANVASPEGLAALIAAAIRDLPVGMRAAVVREWGV